MGYKLSESEAARLRPRRRYPWNEWTDGSTWRIEQGEDFDVFGRYLRTQMYREAKLRGLKVSVQLLGPVGAENVVVFRFYPDPKLGVVAQASAPRPAAGGFLPNPFADDE